MLISLIILLIPILAVSIYCTLFYYKSIIIISSAYALFILLLSYQILMAYQILPRYDIAMKPIYKGGGDVGDYSLADISHYIVHIDQYGKMTRDIQSDTPLLCITYISQQYGTYGILLDGDYYCVMYYSEYYRTHLEDVLDDNAQFRFKPKFKSVEIDSGLSTYILEYISEMRD